jgi:hypothetical protein
MSTQQVLDHDLDAGGHSIMTSLGSVVTIDTGKITIQNGNAFPITVGEGEYDDALTWISTAGWELGSVVYLMAQGPIPVAPSVSTPPAGFGAVLLPGGVPSLTLVTNDTAQFVLTGAGWLYVSAPRAKSPSSIVVMTTDAFTKTNSNLDSVPFLAIPLPANSTGSIEAHLPIVTGSLTNNGGWKIAILGTSACVSNFLATLEFVQEYPDPTGSTRVPLLSVVQKMANATDGEAVSAITGQIGTAHIYGSFTTNLAGSISVRFAQKTTNAWNSALAAGASMTVVFNDSP